MAMTTQQAFNKAVALSHKYTDDSLVGGGAVRGKNCTIKSLDAIENGTKITFEWTLDNGTVQTDYIEVMNGEAGLGIKSVDIDDDGHLIITFDDDTTYDAGELKIGSDIQKLILPEASVETLGHIYQYIGPTINGLVNGYFYQCVLEDSTYKWAEKKVQKDSGGGSADYKELYEDEYNALSEEEKHNGTIYFIIDGKGGGGGDVPIAITETVGVVKPDGDSITVDPDGTIHSVGGNSLTDEQLQTLLSLI